MSQSGRQLDAAYLNPGVLHLRRIALGGNLLQVVVGFSLGCA